MPLCRRAQDVVQAALPDRSNRWPAGIRRPCRWAASAAVSRDTAAAGRYGVSGLGAPYPIRSTAWPPGSVIGVLHAGRYSARCALISAWIQPG
jgi:hypothetical protein